MYNKIAYGELKKYKITGQQNTKYYYIAIIKLSTLYTMLINRKLSIPFRE